MITITRKSPANKLHKLYGLCLIDQFYINIDRYNLHESTSIKLIT